MDNSLPWYNYTTNEYDWRITPETDQDALMYLPQLPIVQGLYKLYRASGESIGASMRKVLATMLGVPHDTR